MKKCLEKDIGLRYQHADDLLADLKRVRSDSNPEKSASVQHEPMEKKRVSRSLLMAGFITTILILATAGYFLFKDRGKSAAVVRGGGRHSLAVLYFENNSGDRNLDKWRSQLAELLITDLSQSRLIDVASGDQVFSILKKLKLLDTDKYSSEDLRRVADQGGSDYVIRGSYITAGKNLLINVALQEAATGNIVSSLRVEARGEEEIFSKVDEITCRIKLDCDFTPQQLASDPDKEMAAITTSSPQAFSFYSEGETQKRLGNYRKCIELMEKAVAIDPDFAMAWRSKATGYGNMGYWDDEIRKMNKAMQHLDRVSERERLLIAGQYYGLRDKSLPKAIESYQQALDLYPNDALVAQRLGLIFDNLEEWEKAENLFRINLLDRNENSSYWSSYRLSLTYNQTGQYQKALQVLTDYQARFPGNGGVWDQIAITYHASGQYAAALDAIDKALVFSPENQYYIWDKGNILFCQGDLLQAEAWYRKLLLLQETVSRGIGLYALGHSLLVRGRYAEAKKLFQEVLALAAQNKQKEWERLFQEGLAFMDCQSGNFDEAQENLDAILANARETDDWTWLRTIFYDKGVTFAEAGLLAEAGKMAAVLQVQIDQGLNKKFQRLHDHLLGLIALKRGDAATAVDLINRAVSLLPGGDRETFRDTLGDALFQAGRLAEACQAYEAVTLSPAGRLNRDYGRCLFLLGKTYQRLGDQKKAEQNYLQFIDFWKNCDAQFRPMLHEAKTEIALLKKGM